VCLSEAYTWSTALDGMRARGVVLGGVEVDEDGMIPAALEREIARFHARGLTPKALYIVPNGSNPCGSTLSAARFGRIYAICLQHGICIWEDDPYWWLSLGEDAPLPGPRTSFASIDTGAIVVRLDSFAKCIAPGFRLGWVAGPPRIIHAFNGANSTSTHNGAPFAMVALHALLEQWGEAGLHAHLSAMRGEYRRRMAVVLRAADCHLKGLASWKQPRAGMFLWLDLSPSRVADASVLMPALREQRVLTIPSVLFSPVGRPSAHMRISFSVASDADLTQGVSRLAAVLREHRDASPAG
jgi:DNA-binding transcriptional MocR family regulator